MLSERNHSIEVRIRSEAIFNSGEKERNLVQAKVLADHHGLVYFHAKSLKGQLKRQAFRLLRLYQNFDEQRAELFLNSIVKLFGINSGELKMAKSTEDKNLEPGQGIMKLGPLELHPSIRAYFIALQAEGARDRSCEKFYRISAHDLIEAQTHIRTGIQVEEGRAKEKRLTTYHTVKEGLIFYSSVYFDIDPVPAAYLGDLQRIVRSLDRIGAGVHRGRGEVESRLLFKGEEADYFHDRDREGERACAT